MTLLGKADGVGLRILQLPLYLVKSMLYESFRPFVGFYPSFHLGTQHYPPSVISSEQSNGYELRKLARLKPNLQLLNL